MNRSRFFLASTFAAGWLILAVVSVSVAAQQTTSPAAPQTTPPAASGAITQADMPDGPGKALLIKSCTKCHGVDRIVSKHRDPDGWTAVITQMVGFGAVGTDEELGTILDYLSKNYGVDHPAAPAGAPGEK
jgi:competence protein ComEA